VTQPSGRLGAWTVVGAAALMVICCAGPVLLAGGALSGAGAALRNPWLISIGALIVLAAPAWTVSRIARHRPHDSSDPCCPPVPPQPPSDIDTPKRPQQ
jgi:mercuric ion transport protein